MGRCSVIRGRRPLALALLPLCLATSCSPKRPSLPADATLDTAFLDAPARRGLQSVPGGWLRRVGPGDGLAVARFEGKPYDLGLAFGRLGRPLLRAQENHLSRLFEALIPSPIVRTSVLTLFSLRLRALPDAIPEDLLQTIAGTADGYEPAPRPGEWPAYRRLINMHALHEVSQTFVDTAALAAACTGFVATGPATRGGITLLARNFDFEGGDVFDRDKLVSIVAPDGKIPYLAVGYPGMSGVVSGFNREGLGVAVHSIAGGETGTSGEPTTILLADVLRNESTVAGAIERIRAARVFVSDLVLLAEAAGGRVAVVEKSPSAFAVREVGSEGFIGVTNEAKDEAVRRRGRPLPPGSTSRRREERLLALLHERRGTLDVAGAAAILRDRTSAGGVSLGPGNRNAIDALIASHSAVFDLTRRQAHVAMSPHTLGAFVTLDLETLLADRDGTSRVATSVPEDALLASGDFGRYRAARRALARARRLGRADALADLELAHALSPGFVDATAHLAEALASRDRDRALALLDEALAHDPAPEPFRVAVKTLRDALATGGPLPAVALPWSLTPDESIEESGAKDRPVR